MAIETFVTRSDQKSTKFIRGQVYHWSDPVAGCKNGGNSRLYVGDACRRFSRYVIIAQTTDTISSSTVLVIPCTSKSNIDMDVKIPLAHNFVENFTYAKVNEMFPVHPRYLDSYVCTLPDEVMDAITAVIIRFLVPDIYDAFCTQQFTIPDILVRNMELIKSINTSPTPSATEEEITSAINKFIAEYILRAPTGSANIFDIKDAYDAMLEKEKLNGFMYDVVAFEDTFIRNCKILQVIPSNRNKYPYGNTVEGIILKGTELSAPNHVKKAKPDKVVKSTKPTPAKTKRPDRLVWTVERKSEFVQMYDKEGIEKCMEKYHITKSTAITYYGDFRRDIRTGTNGTNNSKETKTPKEDPRPAPPVGKPAEVFKSQPYNDSGRAFFIITRFSNMLEEYLKSLNMFYTVRKFAASKKFQISEDQFYKDIYFATYYGIVNYLGCTITADKRLVIPTNVNETSSTWPTWQFLTIISNDEKYLNDKNLINMMNTVRAEFGAGAGIDPNVCQLWNRKMFDSMNIQQIGVDKIVNAMRSVCCSKSEVQYTRPIRK